MDLLQLKGTKIRHHIAQWGSVSQQVSIGRVFLPLGLQISLVCFCMTRIPSYDVTLGQCFPTAAPGTTTAPRAFIKCSPLNNQIYGSPKKGRASAAGWRRGSLVWGDPSPHENTANILWPTYCGWHMTLFRRSLKFINFILLKVHLFFKIWEIYSVLSNRLGYSVLGCSSKPKKWNMTNNFLTLFQLLLWQLQCYSR
jgi:hypothetical protein